MNYKTPTNRRYLSETRRSEEARQQTAREPTSDTLYRTLHRPQGTRFDIHRRPISEGYGKR